MSVQIHCDVTYSLRAGIPAEENSMQSYQDKQKNRQIINARSLSLEVTKHKHRLAAQLVSEIVFLFINLHIYLGFGETKNRLQVMRILQAHSIEQHVICMAYEISRNSLLLKIKFHRKLWRSAQKLWKNDKFPMKI